MSLVPGQKLSCYEILAPLGAGGMGEVWRARDTRLGREIAIKVLPENMAGDADRLARLHREARTLALVNHPNIATIHGLDQADGTTFLMMELVVGEDLAERLQRGPLPVSAAIDICRQIADGLEAAHEAGVVHRDLKPANVRITPAGVVKLLDFGLAKPMNDAAGTADPTSRTSSFELTADGMLLGTPTYMSPEQARGLPLDRRTDVWAFGCLLFEALTGRKAFAGATVSDTIAAVLKQEPDWTALPADTPPSLRRLLRRALMKEQRHRLRDIADARLDLDDAEDLSDAAATPTIDLHRSANVVRVVVAVAVIAAMAFGWWWWEGTAESDPAVWRGEALGGPAVAMAPQPSPDGQLLVFGAMVAGTLQVALMKPQTGNWTVLTRDRTRGTVDDLAWSPDASRIYFTRVREAEGGIYSVPVLGGEERLVLADARGLDVLPDGSLLTTRTNASEQAQLCRYWPESGRVEMLPAVVSWSQLVSPALCGSHDGRFVVYVGRPLEGAAAPVHLYLLEFGSGRTTTLAPASRLSPTIWGQPICISRDDRSVYFAQPFGNEYRVVSVPTSGAGEQRTLLVTTDAPSELSVGRDGAIYLDQLFEEKELFVAARDGGDEVRMRAPNARDELFALPIADGRVVYGANAGGRDRLMVTGRSRDAMPMFDIDEETAGPLASAGPDRLVLLTGAKHERVLAIASVSEARIVQRLPGVDATGAVSIAGTPDGRTVVFAANGTARAVDVASGAVRELGPAEEVAMDPDGRAIVATQITPDGVRLVRLPLDGGDAQPIALPDGVKLSTELGPNAVTDDGRIAIRLITADSWYWPAGILDPKTGELQQVQDERLPSTNRLGWTEEGALFAFLGGVRASVWRYRVE